MRDKDLYAQILGIKSPWQVSGVELALSEGEVTVHVEQEEGVQHCCPTCGEVSPGYDSRKRKWRHLDTCQYKTILVADVPRVKCKEHGVVTVSVPWAEPGSGFTAMFEALVIDWLKEASTAAVSRLMGLSWNAIDGIMQRAVKRGLSRREELSMTQIGVDETAFKKRHDYVTIVSDQEAGTVLFVGEDRKKATLKAWYESLTEAQREAIESISMDMWPAFINATLESLPKVEDKIAFDKFHVAKYLGEAVDKVRRQEHKTLMAEGYEDLKGSKYDWLTNPDNMTRKQKDRFKALRDSTLKTARAWAIKELAMSLWHYVSKTWARKGWEQWLSWAVRSRLEPIKKVAKTIKEHLWGILNAIVLKVSNGPAEGLNSRIKMIKVRSRGFRNKERFANAIYFHLGGLDLYPDGITSVAFLMELIITVFVYNFIREKMRNNLVRVAVEITLDKEEQDKLEKIVRSSLSPVRLAQRAQIVLMANEGMRNQDIANALGIGRVKVSRWRNRYAQSGLAGIERDLPRGAPPQKVDIKRLVDLTTQHKPAGATHWSTRKAAAELGVHASTISRHWRRLGLKPHLEQTFKVSRDPKFVEKLEDIVGLYMSPPENALVLCCDEKSQIQALDRTQPGLPLKKGRVQTMTHDYKRNGTTTLFAALNVLDGTVIGQCQPRHRHTEWLKFLQQIDRETPKDKTLHLIADNYATHKHPEVQKWLEKHPRFVMHFTPTSASWLNMIERFFRDLSEERLRRGVFTSVSELIEAVDQYIAIHNQKPKPFIWTAKAKDILAKVVRANRRLSSKQNATLH